MFTQTASNACTSKSQTHSGQCQIGAVKSSRHRYTPPALRWKCVFTLLVIVGFSPWVCAGTVVVVQDQSNSVTENAGAADSSGLSSYWRIGCDNAQRAVVCWTCSSFQGRKNHKHHADASIYLRLQQAHGPLACSLACPGAKTDIKHGNNQATVAACLDGTGQGCFEVKIAFESDPETTANDDYAVNVYATITAR